MSNNLKISNNLDKLFSEKKLTDFFLHMFFDEYIINGNGNHPKISCNIFKILLQEYNNLSTVLNKDKTNSLIIYFENAIKIIDTYDSIYSVYKDNIMEILNENNKCFISAGWISNFGNENHSVGIFIEDISNSKSNLNKKYNIKIINSGSGLKYHKDYEKNINNIKNNIIINFEINNKELDNLLILIKQCNCKIKFSILYKLSSKINKEFKNFRDNDNVYNNNIINNLLVNYSNKNEIELLFEEY